MKIFSNFDTELDKKTFLRKIERYGNNNVLLVKRHPLFLYKAFFNALFALVLFSGLIILIYMQYSAHIEYFYIFLILHILGIGLWVLVLLKKIISNLWEYKEFITKKEDLDDIDLTDFDGFLKYSIVLFFYQFFVSIGNILTLYSVNNEKTLTLGWGLGIFILNFLFLLIIIRILKRFIDFEMDFILVTKDEIELFDQSGIFKRKIISLDTRKIRTITTQKDGFFKSLFNIGSLKILSEGDSEHKGEINFNYIHRLGKLKQVVLDLIQNSSYRKDLDLLD